MKKKGKNCVKSKKMKMFQLTEKLMKSRNLAKSPRKLKKRLRKQRLKKKRKKPKIIKNKIRSKMKILLSIILLKNKSKYSNKNNWFKINSRQRQIFKKKVRPLFNKMTKNKSQR